MNMLYSNQDNTLNQTEDNKNNDAFFTTNAGDYATNIVPNSHKDTVTGHVIFNQIGTCTRRQNHNIVGTSRQQHMVQNL